MIENSLNYPKRILHVLGGLERGGAETFVMNLYRKIDREKLQFDFIIHTNEHGAYYNEIVSLGGKVYSCPKYTGKHHFQYRKWWEMFISSHPEYRILHSHVRSTAAIYLKIAKKYGLKTIIHSHSTSNGSGVKSLAKRVLQLPLRRVADYLFACSEQSGIWLYGKRKVRTDKFRILKNVIDVEKNAFNPDIRRVYREELELSNKTVYIHVGRFHPAKNHDFLLGLFKRISDKDKNAALLLVGDGELRESILDKIESLYLADKVFVLGSRGDVGNLLWAADCFLFPSLWEGVPLTVIEAQAAGLPCLVSDKVTDDVCVSELVTRLPVDAGAEPWMDALSELDFTRKNVLDKITESGYDAKALAVWLENFYTEVG